MVAYMLSISVAPCVVILVGLVIEGYRLALYILLMDSAVGLFSNVLNRSILKSPQTKSIFLLFMSAYSSSRILCILYTQLTDYL